MSQKNFEVVKRGPGCGQVNWNHPESEIKSKVIEGINEVGSKVVFERRTCGACGLWLGDVVIKSK